MAGVPHAQTADPAASKASKKNGAGDSSDKKTSLRAATAAGDAVASSAEHPVAGASAADAAPTPSVTSSTQQQVAAAVNVPATSNDTSRVSKDESPGTKDGLPAPLARLERGTSHSARSGRGEGPPQVDPARFVSRVARAVQTAQERGGPLQLRLSPPELGTMRLELSVHQGTLTAKVETDNQTARQLLLDNLPALRDRLAEQNVKIDRFDVDVRRDPSGGQQNFAPHDRGAQHRQDRGPSRSAPRLGQAAPPLVDEAMAIRRTITNTSINVVA